MVFPADGITGKHFFSPAPGTDLIFPIDELKAFSADTLPENPNHHVIHVLDSEIGVDHIDPVDHSLED
jgi:hypothetical protein